MGENVQKCSCKWICGGNLAREEVLWVMEWKIPSSFEFLGNNLATRTSFSCLMLHNVAHLWMLIWGLWWLFSECGSSPNGWFGWMTKTLPTQVESANLSIKCCLCQMLSLGGRLLGTSPMKWKLIVAMGLHLSWAINLLNKAHNCKISSCAPFCSILSFSPRSFTITNRFICATYTHPLLHLIFRHCIWSDYLS